MTPATGAEHTLFGVLNDGISGGETPGVRGSKSDPAWGRHAVSASESSKSKPSGAGIVSGGGFGTGTDVEFFVDMFAVSADGFGGDAEDFADFLVEIALGEQGEDLIFPFAEALDVGAFSGLAEIAD